MSQVQIKYQGKMKFLAHARNHELIIDLPVEKGGEDSSMTPPEVFLASLGSCVGVYVAKYCQNAKIDSLGMTVDVDCQYSDDKTKIDCVSVRISLPHAELGKRKDALLEVAKHCLIHKTILGQPQINVSL